MVKFFGKLFPDKGKRKLQPCLAPNCESHCGLVAFKMAKKDLKPRCFQEATVFVWNCKLTESCNMLSPVWHFDTYIIDILWHYKALHVVTFAIFCGGTMLSSNIKHKWYPPSPLRKNDLSLLSLVFSIEQNTIKSNYTYTINLDGCGLSGNSELYQCKALL